MTERQGGTAANPGRQGIRLLLVALLLAYPWVLHWGIAGDHLLPAAAILLAVLGLLGILMLAEHNPLGALPLLAGALLGILLLDGDTAPESILKLPPVLINALLCLIFTTTLRAGQKPLITRFAELSHAEGLDAAAQRYTRGMTQLWSLLFAGLLLESLLLAWLAPLEIWSLFTNFINYLLLILVFAVEYRLRIRRLAHLQHPGFIAFLVSLRRVEWRRLL